MPSFGQSVRLNKIPVVGIVPETSATAPTSPRDGQLWVNTASAFIKLNIYDAESGGWQPWDIARYYQPGSIGTTALADGSVTAAKLAGSIPTSKFAVDPLARANHTGFQVAATISDFDTQVRTSRLDQLAVPTNPVSLNTQRITNLANPTGAQDASTKSYVDTAVANLINAAPGVLDTLSELATALGNDPNFATTITTRLASDEARITALEGKAPVAAGAGLLRTGDTIDLLKDNDPNNPLVINADSVGFGTLAIAKGGTGATTVPNARTGLNVPQRGYAADVPAIIAGGSVTITHNLGTSDVIIQTRSTVSGDVEFIGWSVRTTNSVVLFADIAYGAGDLRVVILPAL